MQGTDFRWVTRNHLITHQERRIWRCRHWNTFYNRFKWVCLRLSTSRVFEREISEKQSFYISQSLNWTNHGIEILLFCYMINSQIMDHENCLLTWSIPIIIPYIAIFSKNWCSVTFCLVFSTGSRLVWTGFTQYLLFHYSQEKMIFCILPINTDTNWNKHSLKRVLALSFWEVPMIPDCGYNISIPWMVEFSDLNILWVHSHGVALRTLTIITCKAVLHPSVFNSLVIIPNAEHILSYSDLGGVNFIASCASEYLSQWQSNGQRKAFCIALYDNYWISCCMHIVLPRNNHVSKPCVLICPNHMIMWLLRLD